MNFLGSGQQIRERYEKALQELDRSSPRYMEEMESVFEQGQALEQRRIVFLKSAFLALHRRLDITADSRCGKRSLASGPKNNI